MTSPEPSPGLRRWRRMVVVTTVALSLTAIVSGYSGSRVFAWHMFPEASTWEAEIVRIDAAGNRQSIDAPWPGGYRWSELVTESGLTYPAGTGNAAYGIATTLDALQHALDWVAASTPDDDETVYLEAVVRYRHNHDPQQTVTIRSQTRDTS